MVIRYIAGRWKSFSSFFLVRRWQHRKKTRTISLEKRMGLHTSHQYVASTLRSSNQFNLTPYAKHVGERRKQSFAQKNMFQTFRNGRPCARTLRNLGEEEKICSNSADPKDSGITTTTRRIYAIIISYCGL